MTDLCLWESVFIKGRKCIPHRGCHLFCLFLRCFYVVKILAFDFSIYNEIWTDWVSAGIEGNMLFNFCEMMKIVFSFVKITTRFICSANEWVQGVWEAGVASALIKPMVKSSTQSCMLFAPSFSRCSLPWTWTEQSSNNTRSRASRNAFSALSLFQI